MSNKILYVSEEVHTKLKILAAKRRTTIKKELEKLINEEIKREEI